MSSTSAIDTLQSILLSVDGDISSVASRLHDEFRRLYPLRDATSCSSSSLNPLTLLTRLRTLQSTLPALRDELLSIHQQKADLADLCRTQLADLHTSALAVLPVAAPTLNDKEATPARNVLYQQLSSALHEREERLEALLSHFLRAHGQFVSLFPALAPTFTTDDLDLALLRAAAANAPEQARALQSIGSNAQDPKGAESRQSTPRAKPVPKGGERKDGSKRASGKNRETVRPESRAGSTSSSMAESSAADMFVPVDKNVYKRLPRNLKIRAGKFAEINSFYERVWTVLVESGKPVPEKLLVEKLGEQDGSRLEVLKGLTVLTLMPQGWALAKQRKVAANSAPGGRFRR